MKPKIFMTGSTGYVGTKFTEMYGDQFEILGVARSDHEHPVDLLAFDSLKKVFTEFSPDYVLHLAADVGRDATTSNEITHTNPAITSSLIELALVSATPFLFTSTEAVYGGKEDEGGYVEGDPYKPRSPYGVSKAESEKLVIASGLPYLITRGHRHVGISSNFDRAKQFPDAVKAISTGQVGHFDPKKVFNPVLINNACDIFAHYILNDADRQVLINIGSDEVTTFYDFMSDVARVIGVDSSLIQPDGEESGWPPNSSLSVHHLHELNYPSVTHEQLLETIRSDYRGK